MTTFQGQEEYKHPHEKLLARQAIREFIANNCKFNSEEKELFTINILINKIEDIIDLI